MSATDRFITVLETRYEHSAPVVIAVYDARELVRIWSSLYPDVDWTPTLTQIQAGVDGLVNGDRNAFWAVGNAADRAQETGMPEGYALAAQLRRLSRLVGQFAYRG